ncbi:Disulfide oxidoreductase [Cedratvirus Zaza IHUMI]|uniref:Sulfhydryl oxidase n=1 Tax=Cedratvirus Zaza IHUMI TaxID=2126979 RepID=A0A2R8FG43_9VIRU|nr:Disulfide oxidoreductase [Cedratvirus Zaza IHUMI]
MSVSEYFPSKPTYSGPGLWFIIHTSAKEAKTEEKKKNFVYIMDLISENHPCADECRPHIKAYREKHPLKNFWNIKDENGEEVGLFLWTFNFHNEVNARIGKKQLDWQTAYHMYANPDVFTPCTSSCHEEEDKVEEDNTKIVPTVIPNKPKFARRER